MRLLRFAALVLTLTVGLAIATGFTAAIFTTQQHDPQQDTTLAITLPAAGKLVNGKPVGNNWVDLLSANTLWNADTRYFVIENGTLHGDYAGGDLHNYAWTKNKYKDFELNALVKLDGENPNSGVCIRINPVNADNVPGYQVDMGDGYWGCLWEEKRAGMVQKFPVHLANKIVKAKDWNHYYVKARGHHIEAWLNGVKTIDVVHATGFNDGFIGFQLCHSNHHTVLDVKSLYVRALK